MSTPPGSQAPFTSGGVVARGPPVFAMPPAVPSTGPVALRPPIVLGAGLPRPLPVPQLAKPPPIQPVPRPGPAVSSPLTLNPPGGKAIPSIVPPKQTTLYVGKIAPSINDELIKQLLDACGEVKSWKRMEDPDTKALKPFGFCEYEEADGVVRALNLLQNLSVGGQELLLKCNTGTQKYIDSIEARKAKDAADGVQAMDVDSKEEGGEDKKPAESAAELDNKALETIMGLVSTHAQQLPPPPEAVAAADSFLSSLKEESERERSRGHEKSSRDRSKSRRESRGDRDDEKALEASFSRERESERKEAQARLHQLDQAYKTALRKWEAQESDARKNAQRDKEHEKDLAKERVRQLKADLEADADAGEDAWQRKLYAGSRRAADRKRWREKEAHEDEADREKEAEEVVKRAKYEEDGANGHASKASTPATSPEHSHPRLQDPNDSITQAMMNAAKAPRKQPTPAAANPEPQPLPGPPTREPAATSGGKKAPILAAFGGEEEEDKPRRTLKPIAYSEEEQKAAQRVSPTSSKEKAAAIKRLIAKVPTEIKAVFSYDIDWKSFDEGGKGLRKKIQAWVEKKTAELLGVAEASMVDFIMSKLDEHISAKKLLVELLLVLDDEANPFVFKLYRMVIFETLKQAAGLQD